MIKRHFKLFSLLLCSVLWTGCALQQVQAPFQAMDLNPKLRAASQKTDAFLVILDSSASMRETYKGQDKLTLAKEILVGMNQTIPALSLTAGLRTFGNTFCPVTKKTALVYGLTDYSKPGFEQAVQQVKWASGRSPLGKAIDGATGDLKTAQGQIAVIIVTDAQQMPDDSLSAAQAMKAAFGDRLCIYTVLIGNDAGGKALLEKIAQTGACGFSVSGDALVSAQGMADFVEKVFLGGPGDSDGDGVSDDRDQCPNTPKGVPVDSKGCPLDSDGDGVYDHMDQCPGTPKGVKVDSKGCPLDSDGDGVYDYQDECPETPKGAKVNARGCWVFGSTASVLFETAKWDLKPAAYPMLDDVVAILQRDSNLRVEIQGHTDNVGSKAYNQNLSKNRAQTVLNHLVQKGVAKERLTAVGYDFSKPAASNDTAEGRAMNRRVELKPIR
jgi:OOP family OmpA-OmpF porin